MGQAPGLRRAPSPPNPLALIALLLGACTSQTPLPELPAVDPKAFLPAIRATVQQAIAAAKASPDDAQANGRLGMILHAHDQPSAASQAYRRAARLDPKAFAWPYYLAHTESTQGKYAAAAEAIESALALDPDYFPAQLKKAEILFEQGRLDESALIYGSATPRHSDSALAWYGLGRVQAVRGETAKAIESLEKACRLFPQFGGAHYALAQGLRKAGRIDEAQAHLAVHERYKTWYPGSGDRYLQDVLRLSVSATNYLRRGVDQDAAGRIAEAIELHRKAVEVDPRSAQAHANLISLYGRTGQNDRAVAAYHAAVDAEPGHAEAHYNYGVLLFGQKQIAGAKEAFLKAVDANPYHASALNNLGYIVESEGKQADATNFYRRAIAAQPSFRLAHFHLGRILTTKRDYAGAIAEFEKTLDPVDDQTPGFLYGLGAAYGRSGQRAKAVEILTRAHQMAAERNQTGLAASIAADLRTLGVGP